MNLQELTNIWHSADHDIENHMKINKALLNEVSVHKIKSNLREIKWSNIFEIIANILFLMFLVGFVAAHFSALPFAIPAFLLIGFSIFSLVFCSYKLSLYYGIDAKASVLQNQKKIEKLKYYELVEKNLLYVIIPVFSTTFLIVMAKALFDYDLYRLGHWLVTYTLGSFVVALIIVFMLKRYPNKNLQKSIDFLKEINETEKVS